MKLRLFNDLSNEQADKYIRKICGEQAKLKALGTKGLYEKVWKEKTFETGDIASSFSKSYYSIFVEIADEKGVK